MAGEAWRRRQKQLLPDSSPSRQSGPVARRLSASIRFPLKNSLISNGLILCSQYGLRMFSLMAFQSYAIEQKQDYKMSFSFQKKLRLEIENVRDPSCSYLILSAADNRVWDLLGGMMTENENAKKKSFKQVIVQAKKLRTSERLWKTSSQRAGDALLRHGSKIFITCVAKLVKWRNDIYKLVSLKISYETKHQADL